MIIQISDAPWIGYPDYGRKIIEPIAECSLCEKPLYEDPAFVEDEYVLTEDGFICRECFCTKYFDFLKGK